MIEKPLYSWLTARPDSIGNPVLPPTEVVPNGKGHLREAKTILGRAGARNRSSNSAALKKLPRIFNRPRDRCDRILRAFVFHAQPTVEPAVPQ